MKLLLLLVCCSFICYAQEDPPGDYPEGSTEELVAYQISMYDLDQLVIMRNEIFARYGYIFKKPELREHFTQQDWYKPTEPDVNKITAKLTDIEKANIQLFLAREAWLRPIAIQKLPLLKLPLNLEKEIPVQGSAVAGIQPNSKQGAPYAFVGLLPDTSKFFAVLWYRQESTIAAGQEPRGYYISTYNKQRKELATASVALPCTGYIDYGPTDCRKENLTHQSTIASNLTFVSRWTYKMTCPAEKLEDVTYEVVGCINSDGTITVTSENNPYH